MLAFTPHLSMLAAFCSLLAITVLPASTIAAAIVESEGFYPVQHNDISRNILSGGKREALENDKRNEQLGVPGTIQVKSLAPDGHATALVVTNINNGERFILAEADGARGTPLFMVQVQSADSIPFDFTTSPGVSVYFRVAPFTASDYCVTADLDTAHRSPPLTVEPLTVEPCADFKTANAHKTQVFRYNKQTGIIQALPPTTSSNGAPSNAAPTRSGPYHGHPLAFVPGVPNPRHDKDASLGAADGTTANTATEAEAETETSAQSGSSTSTQ